MIQRLDRIEKEHDSHELTAMTHLLETIDDAVEDANDGDNAMRHLSTTTSVLSRKASRDIGAARYVRSLFNMSILCPST